MNSFIFSALVALALSFYGPGAVAAHKCVVNGTVTYQQTPCASGEARKAPTVQELNAQEKQRRTAAASAASAASAAPVMPAPATPIAAPRFRCDTRQYCAQMTSCAEAKYFLAHCAGVKMDGDKNGVPCEQQWCKL